MNRNPENLPSDWEAWMPSKAIEELTVRRALTSHDDPVKLANQLLRESLPIAVMGMKHLALYETNSVVRFNAQKYIIERVMGGTNAKALPATDKPAWEKIFDSVAVSSEGGDDAAAHGD